MDAGLERGRDTAQLLHRPGLGPRIAGLCPLPAAAGTRLPGAGAPGPVPAQNAREGVLPSSLNTAEEGPCCPHQPLRVKAVQDHELGLRCRSGTPERSRGLPCVPPLPALLRLLPTLAGDPEGRGSQQGPGPACTGSELPDIRPSAEPAGTEGSKASSLPSDRLFPGRAAGDKGVGWGERRAPGPGSCRLQCPDPARTPSLRTHNPAPQGKARRALIYGPPRHAGASLPFRLPERPARASSAERRGQGRASIPRLPKSLGLTGGGWRGSGCFSGPRHGPLLWRLLVACQPPVCRIGTRLLGPPVWGALPQCPRIWSQALRGPWVCLPHAVGFGGAPRDGMVWDLQGG